MTTTKLMLRSVCLCMLLLLGLNPLWAQTKTVTGTVKDEKGGPVQGASVSVKGTTRGTTTNASGSFSISVKSTATTLVVSYVGYASQEVNISSAATADVTLKPENSSLNDIIVVGYGTARKKDLTGAVASVQSKDFNKGVVASPDQLLQGVVAGLEVTSNTGQPGSATTVKIRGNNSIRSGNNPLYVIDGVPLDGRSARPGLNANGLGNTPDANPLIFINPSEIASIDVLKDASASAIYGSRGANGVILITTKRGVPGTVRIEGGASAGISDLMRQPDILDAGEYRGALAKYGAKSDSGLSIKPFNEIIRHAVTQNYTFALAGGNENGKYRASFLASNQEGLLKKSNLKKYVANFNGDYTFFDKKLNIIFNFSGAHTDENIAPISNDAGSTGNIISAAMNWNPTLYLSKNGIYNQTNPSGQINPTALSDAYTDKAVVTTILGNINAGYKFTPWLEYRFLYGLNYSTGNRKQQLEGWLTGAGNPAGQGAAAIGNNELFSQTLTHTLNFNHSIAHNLNLQAIAGYEYYTSSYKGNAMAATGFDFNLDQTKRVPIKYYDLMQDANPAKITTSSFIDPTFALQSFFGRTVFNYNDKYLLTATFRADGSTRFGSNNRYAYFPSFAAAWNIMNEDFMKGSSTFSNLRLRFGYGQTGNQQFPSGISQFLGQYTTFGGRLVTSPGNPDLKWETVSSYDGGVDFGFFHNRLSGYIDVFSKKTTNPLFLATLPQPSSGSNIYVNLTDGYLTNKGFEVSLTGLIVQAKNFNWTVRVNGEYIRNKFYYPSAGNSPLQLTGAINGQGVSNTFAQAIANDQPIDVFYLRTFSGFDKNGIAITTTGSSYVGDPNPHVNMGIATDLSYKKWSLGVNMHGAFGGQLFNNTLLSVTNLGNITNGKNISKSQLNSAEGLANPVSASTRFMVSGNYMKLGNATLSYNIGKIGNVFKSSSVYFTGSNLFEITKYKGFDAEVNIDKNNNGIPSLGIDYIGFPTARTFLLGVNFSL